MNIRKKEIIILCSLFIFFFVIHLPGLNLPYHQDEYKWPIIVNPALTAPGGIPHPPVGEFIYRELGKVVGYDNFRIIPFIFGILNFFLLFYLVKTMFNIRVALWSVFLFTISFYSLLASLMVDTDGAIMPFFFLVMTIAYLKLTSPLSPPLLDKERGLGGEVSARSRWLWGGVLIVATLLGFLTKTSFIIAIGAFALDFAIERGVFSNGRKFFKYLFYCIGLGVLLVLALFAAKLIFPSFNLQFSISYWEHFAKLSGRGWLQTFIQFSKSVLYVSPLLALPVFFLNKEMIKKTRPFLLFISIGLAFYLFLFDFSTGALDRYFQFLVIPLCIISAAVLTKNSFLNPINLSQAQVSKTLAQADEPSREIFQQENIRGLSKLVPRKNLLLIFLLLLLIFLLQFLPHFVPPLHPKTEWLSRVIHFRWNFLFPFTGGSGPTGFYVSFLFMALIWFISFVFTGRKFLLGVLFLGILYNGVFIEEYLFGKINGSPYPLFTEAKAFIADNNDIKKVVVYNDIGGYEIQKTGKYERRLYAAPQFEQDYRNFFKDFSGHVLYIDIPRIGENNFYSNYLNSCKDIYEKKDRYITAKIFECRDTNQ